MLEKEMFNIIYFCNNFRCYFGHYVLVPCSETSFRSRIDIPQYSLALIKRTVSTQIRLKNEPKFILSEKYILNVLYFSTVFPKVTGQYYRLFLCSETSFSWRINLLQHYAIKEVLVSICFKKRLNLLWRNDIKHVLIC